MRASWAKVREATDRGEVGRAAKGVVADRNHVLGVGADFRYGNSGWQFAQIDSHLQQRLAIVAGIKQGRHGRHWQRHYPWAWATRLGSIVSAGQRGTGLVMPCGERCREAGCGSTPCPV